MDQLSPVIAPLTAVALTNRCLQNCCSDMCVHFVFKNQSQNFAAKFMQTFKRKARDPRHLGSRALNHFNNHATGQSKEALLNWFRMFLMIFQVLVEKQFSHPSSFLQSTLRLSLSSKSFFWFILPHFLSNVSSNNRRLISNPKIPLPLKVTQLLALCRCYNLLKPDSIVRLYKTILNVVDIGERVRFHDLHHTFATLILTNGVQHAGP